MYHDWVFCHLELEHETQEKQTKDWILEYLVGLSVEFGYCTIGHIGILKFSRVHDIGFLSIYCECILLSLANKVLSVAEYSKAKQEI